MSVSQVPISSIRAGYSSTPSLRIRTRRRVLQVITPSHMSGAEMQLVRLTKRMQERGHAMPILVKRNFDDLVEMARYDLQLESAAIGGKLNALAIHRIARAARNNRADLVQSTAPRRPKQA